MDDRRKNDKIIQDSINLLTTQVVEFNESTKGEIKGLHIFIDGKLDIIAQQSKDLQRRVNANEEDVETLQGRCGDTEKTHASCEALHSGMEKKGKQMMLTIITLGTLTLSLLAFIYKLIKS